MMAPIEIRQTVSIEGASHVLCPDGSRVCGTFRRDTEQPPVFIRGLTVTSCDLH